MLIFWEIEYAQLIKTYSNTSMEKEKYKIGLDLGITSVGFAALATDSEGDECKRIIEAGSRIFNIAEDEKGKSLAAPRRQKRSMRRGVRRRAHRLQRIKSLIVREGILSKEEMLNCYARGKHTLRDIYEIRLAALDMLIEREEFARLLIHLAQRRGFRSNRKVEDESVDNSEKKVLGVIEANERKMKESKWRTVGEMFMKDAAFAESKRNSGDHYLTTVTRALMLDEIAKIFAAQRALGNTHATEVLEKCYTDIYAAQRNFDDGPGGESPFGGNMIEKMVGACTIYPDERRAPSACYSFELFSLWSKVNTLKIVSLLHSRFLTQEEREKVVALFYKNKGGVTYKQIRKALGLVDNERFNALSYREKSNEEVEKTSLPYLKAHHQLRTSYDKVLGEGAYEALEIEKKDEIARILTYFKNDERIKVKLSESFCDFSEKEVEAILGMKSFNKFGHLSMRAMREITPHLEKGQQYNEACSSAGLDFQAKKDFARSCSLPALPKDQHEINNPVVLRAIHQCIRVINALTKKYGPPVSVHIEVAREVGKNLKERKDIEKDQETNRKANERSKSKLKKDFPEYYASREPNGGDVIKMRLWQEQDGRCMYTGQKIPYERLLETGYCEIDHIIPYSISLDDSYNNKVLSLTASNREKGNRIPLQFITDTHEYKVRVENTVRNFDKKRRLLKEEITEEDMKEMKERNLNDTKYISRYMMNYIKDHLSFDNRVNKKKRVIAVNGRVTSRLRGLWGIAKIREEGDLHHARDAVVIACIGDALIKRVTEYEKRKRSYESAQAKEHFPTPWPRFRHEVECRFSSNPREMIENLQLAQYDGVDLSTIRPVFVSRREVRKTTGSAHKDTIMETKEILSISRLIALKDIPYDVVNHVILNYCQWANAKGLYDLLLKRLKDAKDIVENEGKKLSDEKKSKAIVKKAFEGVKDITLLDDRGAEISIEKVSIIKEEEHMALKRVSLCELKYEPVSHSIVQYYNPDSDVLLYNLLCDRLKACYEEAVKITILETKLSKDDTEELKRGEVSLLQLGYDVSQNILTGCDPDKISESLYAKLLVNMERYITMKDYSSLERNDRFKSHLEKLKIDSFKIEPVMKPAPKGGVSPIVAKVKVYDKINTGKKLNGGIAKNGKMSRVDIYHVDNDGFYFVPVYVRDIIDENFKPLAVIKGKHSSKWKPMKKSNFLFSLYPNTLVRITRKDPIEMEEVYKKSKNKSKKITLSNSELLYYQKADVGSGMLTFINHDKSLIVKKIGLKTITSIEKYYVDELGALYHMPPFKKKE